MRVLSAVLASACAVPASAGAAAATPEETAAAARPGFTVEAVGFASFPRYRLKPGERVRGAIRLRSSSKGTVRVALNVGGVSTAASGGLVYGEDGSATSDPAVTLARRGVRLRPGRAVRVGFTVRVPASATPGDRFAGIVALDRDQATSTRRRDGSRNFSLKFLPRLAVAVQVTVPGPTRDELRLGQVGIDVTPSATDVTLLLRNAGDKLLRKTGGRLEISKEGRVLTRRRVRIDAFVPDSTITYRVPLTGRPAEGTYRVRGILRPDRGDPVPVDAEVSFGAKAAKELKRETGREATASGPSVGLIAALVAAFLLVVALVVALVRMRRRLAAAESGRPPRDS